MDVRARAATLFASLSVTLMLRVFGFAPRHLKRLCLPLLQIKLCSNGLLDFLQVCRRQRTFHIFQAQFTYSC